MTTLELYRKHKSGKVSREKFLYEVRRDNNLPWITNLTSYDDAVKILKNKGIVTDEKSAIVSVPAIGLMTEGQTKEAKKDEAVKAEVKPKKVTEKKPKELHIDQVNPYEYRHGIQHELCELDDYSDEALEKAKDKVLKNLAKDANYYSTLLNQKQSPYEFKQTETDAKGMQAKADGHLKKELKKDEKSNVKDTLGKKEAGKKKPKGVKVMPDKGVTGSEKTIKEGLEAKSYQDGDHTEIEIDADSGDYAGYVEADGTVTFAVEYADVDTITDENWKEELGPNHAFVQIYDAIGGDVSTEENYVQITVNANQLLDRFENIKEGFKAGDTASLDGEEVIITRVSDDDRVYVRRKEDSAKLGKMPEKWVKPEDLKEDEEDMSDEDYDLFRLKAAVKTYYKNNHAEKQPKSIYDPEYEPKYIYGISDFDKAFTDKVNAAKNKEDLKNALKSILMGDLSSLNKKLGLDEKKDKLSKIKEALKKSLKNELSSPDTEIKNTEIKLADLYQQRADSLKKQ